ncbi:Hydroxyacylglutathione hydrolase [termite gut metagenome]|uniref:Hydroxyacylglutathione hydrolase n=1 Tax=termite gut metagenome TaxID=433724 RepID=A0A5J4RV15_9ZZZZ
MNGIKSLYDPKLNRSFYMADYYDSMNDFILNFDDNVHELKEGNRIELWQNIELEAMETPGHDWSCLTYKIDKYLFTGDSYIPGISVFTKLPKSNKEKANESLIKINELQIKDSLIICPGHVIE